MRKLIYLRFPISLTGEPITYNLITIYKLRVNILRASVNYNIEGNLLIEVSGDDKNVEDAIQYLLDQGLNVTEYDASIDINKDSCVSCGACTAVCEVGALSMDGEWKLQLDSKKCLGCKLCIKACPTRSIKNII